MRNSHFNGLQKYSQAWGWLREIRKVFYTKTLISVLGVIVYYNHENSIKKSHVNIVYPLLSYDGYLQVNVMKLI